MSMTEPQIHEEIANLIKQHIDQPFHRVWMGLFVDRGSIASHPRFQTQINELTCSSFSLPMEVSLRITKLAAECVVQRAQSGRGAENGLPVILSDDGSFYVDYSSHDIVKTGWQPVYDAWDKKYLTGLKLVPGKGPFG